MVFGNNGYEITQFEVRSLIYHIKHEIRSRGHEDLTSIFKVNFIPGEFT